MHLWTGKFLIHSTHTAGILAEGWALSLCLRRGDEGILKSVCFWPFTSLCTLTKYLHISNPPSAWLCEGCKPQHQLRKFSSTSWKVLPYHILKSNSRSWREGSRRKLPALAEESGSVSSTLFFGWLITGPVTPVPGDIHPFLASVSPCMHVYTGIYT